MTKKKNSITFFAVELTATVNAIKSGSLGVLPTKDNPGNFGGKRTIIQECDCGAEGCEDRWVIYADDIDSSGQPARCFVQSVALDYNANSVDELITAMATEEQKYAQDLLAARPKVRKILELVKIGMFNEAYEIEFEGGEAVTDSLNALEPTPDLTRYQQFTTEVAQQAFHVVAMYQAGREQQAEQQLRKMCPSVKRLYDAIKDEVMITFSQAPGTEQLPATVDPYMPPEVKGGKYKM